MKRWDRAKEKHGMASVKKLLLSIMVWEQLALGYMMGRF